MSRPSYSSSFDQPKNIWWGVQTIKLLVMLSSPFPCYLVPLRPSIFLSALFESTLSLCSSLSVRGTSFSLIKNRRNYSAVYLTLYIFG
jgi:hypothetical protein